MQPAELKSEQFSNYPPEARKIAEHYTHTLSQLPSSFVPSLLREIVEYDYKFPVERKAVEKELETITALSPADRAEWFAGFEQIKLSQQLVTYDWVNLDGAHHVFSNAKGNSARSLGWARGDLLINFQLDGFNTGSGSITSYIHKMTIFRW